MGEHEQGGMLRVVVVLGIIALIAAVVIGGVITSKANMSKHVNDTTSLVDKMANDASGTDDASTTIFKYDWFREDAKTVSIMGFDTSNPDWKSYSRDLVIPSKLVKNGVTYKVTGIRDMAFSEKQLTSVTIPDTVTTIGQQAFYNDKLTSITIPNSVKSISWSAFHRNMLTSVTIPSSVTDLGRAAFADNQLTSVTIGNGLTSIDDSVFSGNRLTSVTIPKSVTNIESRAFEKNQIESLTLQDGLTTIGEYAFYQNNIKTLMVPDTVKTIGASAFVHNNFAQNSVSIGKNTTYDTSDMFWSFTDDNYNRVNPIVR